MIKKEWKHLEQLNSEEILNHFPEYVVELIHVILQEGFIITLVGGAVRDYLLTGVFSKDLDFELRHPYDYVGKEWESRINHLEDRLQNTFHYKVDLLSFSVMRVHWPDYQFEMELAPARLESFDLVKGLGHSDMEVELVSNRDYSETFARRDFTLNALGIEFYKKESQLLVSFIDPFGGIDHLDQKQLVPCGRNIGRDPVRFCRAIRFALKFKLDFSNELEKSFEDFNLTKLTYFYFFREAFKVDFFHFCEIFFSKVSQAKIPIHEDFKSISFLEHVGHHHLDLKNQEEVLLFLIYSSSSTYEQVESFCKMAKLKKSLIDRHYNFKATLEELEEIDLSSLEAELQKMDFGGFLARGFAFISLLSTRNFHTLADSTLNLKPPRRFANRERYEEASGSISSIF